MSKSSAAGTRVRMLCADSEVKSKFWRQLETTGPKTSSAVGWQDAVPGSKRDWLDIVEGVDADADEEVRSRRRRRGRERERRREGEVRKSKSRHSLIVQYYFTVR
jgi:hypothetical protein